jgi:hypothetical protein
MKVKLKCNKQAFFLLKNEFYKKIETEKFFRSIVVSSLIKNSPACEKFKSQQLKIKNWRGRKSYELCLQLSISYILWEL